MPQCQFLFSAVFGFRKATQEIFSELDETKAEVPIFPGAKTESKPETEEGQGLATPPLGAAPPWPRLAMVWAPRASTDIALPPIYSP